MSYPERLLPKSNYTYINVSELSENSYLLRHTNSQDIWDSLDKLKVDVAMPYEIRRDFFGLSCNLFGIFIYDDIYLRVTTKKLEANWEEGESPLKINTSDFTTAPQRGGFFIKLSSFHGKEFPFKRTVDNKESEFQSTASFHHKPILCNFWHFELHFKDNNGDFINRNKGNKWIKNFAESLRKSVLKKFAIKEVDDFDLPSDSIYTTIKVEGLKDSLED